MGSRGTWLALALVAAIALAAAADALRDGPGQEPAAVEELAPTTTAPGEDSEPPEASPAGTLYYTDESCRLRAVRLPDLEPLEAPGWSECRFVLSPDGTRAAPAGSGWDARSDPRIGRLFQRTNGTIAVATDFGPEGEPFRGRAAAWRPDGKLTYVAGSAVRTWPENDSILDSADLSAAIRSHRDAPEAGDVRTVRFEEIAWLRADRLALLLRANEGTRATQALVAVVAEERLAAVETLGRGWASGLRVSPTGRLFAFRTPTGVRVFDDSGAIVLEPHVRDARAVAFSPDERWLAVAASSGVHVVPLDETRPAGRLPLRRLPLAARDLAWRNPAGALAGPAGAGEARAWLADVGVGGRLLVTDPGCRLLALRLPALEWEGNPTSARSSCRFDLSPEGEAVPEGSAVRAADGLRARCRGGRVVITHPRRAAPYAIANACSPAWTPAGRLTFVREGELWEGLRGEDERLLISRRSLARMLGEPARIAEVAWIDEGRLWAAVRVGGQAALAVLTPTGLQFAPALRATRIERLAVSVSMVAAVTDEGVVLLDSGGRRTLTFPGAHAVAWAPGELVAAVAMPQRVLFVSPVTQDVVEVPLDVEDLEWAER